MTNTKALIISGGDVDYNFRPENCRIIAVDGGLEAAKKWDLFRISLLVILIPFPLKF